MFRENNPLWINNYTMSILNYLFKFPHFHAILHSVVTIFHITIFYLLYWIQLHRFIFWLTEDGRSFCGNMFYKLKGFVVFLKFFTCPLLSRWWWWWWWWLLLLMLKRYMKWIIYELRIWNQVKKVKNSGLQWGLNPWPRDTGATL